MGQRVNIVLKVTDKENKTKVTIYHDQWGIGRKGLLNIISLHHAFYNKTYGKSITETVAINPGEAGIYEEYNLFYNQDKLVKFVRDGKDKINLIDAKQFRKLSNVSNPKSIGEFIDRFCDNNNGAIFIDVVERQDPENPYHTDTDIRYGFLLGSEDEYHVFDYDGEKEICNPENKKLGPAFSQWLSLEEWCNLEINKSYADEKFKNICKDFFDYFGIEEMKS